MNRIQHRLRALVAVSSWVVASCTCNSESCGAPLWLPLKSYCHPCKNLAQRQDEVLEAAGRAKSAHRCDSGEFVLTTCAGGNSTLVEAVDMGRIREYFGANGEFTGADLLGGQKIGSRPSCKAPVSRDFCD